MKQLENTRLDEMCSWIQNLYICYPSIHDQAFEIYRETNFKRDSKMRFKKLRKEISRNVKKISSLVEFRKYFLNIYVQIGSVWNHLGKPTKEQFIQNHHLFLTKHSDSSSFEKLASKHYDVLESSVDRIFDRLIRLEEKLRSGRSKK